MAAGGCSADPMDAGARAERRLFLALWPEPQVAAQWQAWADTLAWPPGARRHRSADLHLTLHFLGATSEAVRWALQARLPQRIAPIALHLDRLQDWDGIAVLRPMETPSALAALQLELAEILSGIGLPVEARRFRPHVTLARRAPGLPVQAPPALTWRAQRLVLAESRQGYHALWSSAG